MSEIIEENPPEQTEEETQEEEEEEEEIDEDYILRELIKNATPKDYNSITVALNNLNFKLPDPINLDSADVEAVMSKIPITIENTKNIFLTKNAKIEALQEQGDAQHEIYKTNYENIQETYDNLISQVEEEEEEEEIIEQRITNYNNQRATAISNLNTEYMNYIAYIAGKIRELENVNETGINGNLHVAGKIHVDTNIEIEGTLNYTPINEYLTITNSTALFNTKAPLNHNHTASDITDLTTTINAAFQNHTHSTFTNITVDSINGCAINPLNNNLVPVPTIPIIKSDGVMEIGRYLDFHTNYTGSQDYGTRLTVSDEHLYIKAGRYARTLTINSTNSDMTFMTIGEESTNGGGVIGYNKINHYVFIGDYSNNREMLKINNDGTCIASGTITASNLLANNETRLAAAEYNISDLDSRISTFEDIITYEEREEEETNEEETQITHPEITFNNIETIKKSFNGEIKTIAYNEDINSLISSKADNTMLTALAARVVIVETDKADLNHTHSISNITNLQTTLNNKSNISHNHTSSDITDLTSTINAAFQTHTHNTFNNSISINVDSDNPLKIRASSYNNNSGSRITIGDNNKQAVYGCWKDSNGYYAYMKIIGAASSIAVYENKIEASGTMTASNLKTDNEQRLSALETKMNKLGTIFNKCSLMYRNLDDAMAAQDILRNTFGSTYNSIIGGQWDGNTYFILSP